MQRREETIEEAIARVRESIENLLRQINVLNRYIVRLNRNDASKSTGILPRVSEVLRAGFDDDIAKLVEKVGILQGKLRHHMLMKELLDNTMRNQLTPVSSVVGVPLSSVEAMSIYVPKAGRVPPATSAKLSADTRRTTTYGAEEWLARHRLPTTTASTPTNLIQTTSAIATSVATGLTSTTSTAPVSQDATWTASRTTTSSPPQTIDELLAMYPYQPANRSSAAAALQSSIRQTTSATATTAAATTAVSASSQTLQHISQSRSLDATVLPNIEGRGQRAATSATTAAATAATATAATATAATAASALSLPNIRGRGQVTSATTTAATQGMVQQRTAAVATIAAAAAVQRGAR